VGGVATNVRVSKGLFAVAVVLLYAAYAMHQDWGWILHPFKAFRMERARRGDSAFAFIQELVALRIDAIVARATYDQMQSVMRIAGATAFPVRATDRLGADYGLSLTRDDDFDHPDLRYSAWQVAEASGRQLPVEWRKLDSELRSLLTVMDLSRWVQELPMRSRGAP
jgi:hypothetical protein